MPAGVQEHIDAALLVPRHDDRLLANVRHEEVAGVRDLGLVAHEVPGTGEDALELQLIDLLVGEDPAVDQSAVDVDPVLGTECLIEVHHALRTSLPAPKGV